MNAKPSNLPERDKATPQQSVQTCATNVLRIAVASDLHAFAPADPGRAKDAPKPSLLNADDDDGRPTHIIESLISTIQTKAIRAEYLICPGDLGHQGSRVGIRHGWKQVRRIATALGAQLLIGTPGNHDFARKMPDGLGALKDLEDFPVAGLEHRTQFWAWDYLLLDKPNCRFILVNTIAEHALDAETDHGLVKHRTIQQIESSLKDLTPMPLQVLVCHHSPHWHGDHKLGDTDLIQNGQLLLDVLAKYGNWLVVHGHKHHAKVARAAGGGAAPFVFAASSLSAMLSYEGHVGNASNQFFVLDFDMDYLATGAWGATGRAWNWATDVGWNQTDATWGEFGFGFSGQLSVVAQQIRHQLKQSGMAYLKWSEVVAERPELRYLRPSDVAGLRGFGLRIQPPQGIPDQVGSETQ